MNAKEARQIAKLVQYVNETNEIEKVIRIEIENAAHEGKEYWYGKFYLQHNANLVVENLKKDGFEVYSFCRQLPIGKEFGYKVFW